MNTLKEIVTTLESHIADIKVEIEKAETNGFVYARSKAIRASAQSIKLAAQGLREVTSDEFKKTQK